MAFFDGKNFRGKIGKVVYKVDKDGRMIVQSAPGPVKQTEASKKTAGVMGNASTLSKQIRTAMFRLFDDNHPGNMINALSAANRTILEHCCDKETMTYTFQEDSFDNLAGFQFNDKSPISSFLWVKPYLTLNENKDKITLTIPAFEIPQQLKMANYANMCEIHVAMGQYALHKGLEKRIPPQQAEIGVNQTEFPETAFLFDIMPGCLGVIGIGFKYYQLQNQIKTPLNSKLLNPAAIVGAIYTPGTFVKPPQEISANRGKADPWQRMDKLNLKAANAEG